MEKVVGVFLLFVYVWNPIVLSKDHGRIECLCEDDWGAKSFVLYSSTTKLSKLNQFFSSFTIIVLCEVKGSIIFQKCCYSCNWLGSNEIKVKLQTQIEMRWMQTLFKNTHFQVVQSHFWDLHLSVWMLPQHTILNLLWLELTSFCLIAVFRMTPTFICIGLKIRVI